MEIGHDFAIGVPVSERIILTVIDDRRFHWRTPQGLTVSIDFRERGSALLWAVNRGYAVRRKGKRIIGIWRKRRLLT